MLCNTCKTEMHKGSKYCHNCGKEIINKQNIIKNEARIPWHRNLTWQHLLLISLIGLFLYIGTGGYIWDFIFVIGLIFTIITYIKSRKNKKDY